MQTEGSEKSNMQLIPVQFLIQSPQENTDTLGLSWGSL